MRNFRVALIASLAIALCARAAAADDGTWSILTPAPGISPTPNQHVSVFVPSRNQIVAYGGNLGSDTWLLDLNALSWSKLTIANPPPGRLGASAIYDPVRDQMVVFGGYTNTYVNEVWTLSLGGTPTWTQVATSGTPPAPRDFASAIYDPVRDRMIVFAGFSGNEYNDVWALDLASMTWSQLWPDQALPGGTSPTQRSGAVAIYDPVGDRMVTAFGGYGGTYANDVWALGLSDPPAWTQLHPTGTAPASRQYSSAVYDQDFQRVVIFGGKQGTSSYADSWELTLGATPNWRQLSPGGASSAARWQHTAMVDPNLHRMLILGGNGTGDLRSLTWPPGTAGPSITSVSPASAHEGDTVTITGLALSTVSGVQFNGTPATIQSNTGTVITVQVPTGATTGPLSLVGPFGVINAPANFVVLNTPSIVSFTPAGGPFGTDVTITGRSFSNATQVIFGSGPSASFMITSDTEIHATVNASATTGPILITNPSGTTSSANSFIVNPPIPEISSISPTSGPPAATVTINGLFLSTVTRVSFTGDNAAPFSIITDSQIQATVSPNAQTGPITLTNPYSSTPTPVFTVVRSPVVITSISPASGPVGSIVTITGQYLSNVTRVTFAGDTASSFKIISDDLIQATVSPNAQTGPITVTNPYGSTPTQDFTVLPTGGMAITAISPTAGPPGATVMITGQSLSNVTRVTFTGDFAASFKIVSDTQITATVSPNAQTGPITVTNPYGAIGTPVFTVVHAPVVITSISPTSGTVGSLVTIRGQYLSDVTRVMFTGDFAASFTIVSDSQIAAIVSLNAQTGPITVTNPYGSTPTPVFMLTGTGNAADGTWSVYTPSPPISPAPEQHVSVFVPSRGQIFAYGGSLGSDTWLLDLNALSWSKLTIASPPPGRVGACAIFDPVRDQMVMFGGYTSDYVNEVWTLSLSGTPAWTQAATSGPSPPIRDDACAIYDRVRDRMIVFAGFAGTEYNDVWALDLASMTWTQLSPSGTAPGPRYGAVAIYDPIGDRMITTFGGIGGTWALNLAEPPSWTQLSPSGTPPANRLFSSAVYDPDFQRMIIYAGRASTSLADTWELLLGTNPLSWAQLFPAGAATRVRYQHTAMIDPALHRMLILGGNDTSDLRSLSWAPDQPTAALASLVSEDELPDRVVLKWYLSNRGSPVNVYRRTQTTDWTRVGSQYPDGQGYVRYEDASVLVGTSYGYRLGIMDAGTEVFAGEVWAAASTPRLALDGILPNPATNGRITVSFALPTNDRASLELVDIAGRRVARREVGSLGPGRHLVALDGGGRLAPGVYLVRLIHAQGTLKARAVVID